MTKHKFAELFGSIDPALIARAEAIEPARKKTGFKIALIAAALALLACAALVITPFIPTTLGIDYITSPIDGTEIAFMERNVWIYYTTESGKQKREYVRLPGDAQNVFAAWAHLNGLGEQYKLYSAEYTDDATLAGRYVIVTCSAALQEHPNAEVLQASLQRTFAAYYGIPQSNVTLYFADPAVILAFSHNLTDTPVQLKAGDTFTVTVTMTNVSNRDLVFEGSESEFVPRAKLLAKSVIYVATEIFPETHDHTTEIAEYRLAPGQSKSVTYTFHIPYQTGSFTITGYDLTVYFGKQSQTFENAISLSYDQVTLQDTLSAFESFTLTHTAESSAEQRNIYDSYTYRSENIMEQMQILSGDGEYFWVEEGDWEQFSYYATGKQMPYGWLSCYTYSFTAQALPDGMTLPVGITEQDTVLDALIKMGVDEQTAMEYLTQQDTVLLAGPNTNSGTIPDYYGSISLVCNPHNYILTYTCQKGVISENDLYPHATRSISLTYDRESQGFWSIGIDVSLPSRPNITFDTLPSFTKAAEEVYTMTLTQEQSDALAKAMTRGKWKSSVVDAEYDYQGTIGDIPFQYASATGQLTVGGFTVHLQSSDRIAINSNLGIST